MTDQRNAIPAELKRRVLIEAGHRCAIHTCRHIDVEIHHIIPWELDILFELYNNDDGAKFEFPPFMHLLIKRIMDSGFVFVVQDQSSVRVSGMRINPDYLVLTGKDREFISHLDKNDLA